MDDPLNKEIGWKVVCTYLVVKISIHVVKAQLITYFRSMLPFTEKNVCLFSCPSDKCIKQPQFSNPSKENKQFLRDATNCGTVYGKVHIWVHVLLYNIHPRKNYIFTYFISKPSTYLYLCVGKYLLVLMYLSSIGLLFLTKS